MNKKYFRIKLNVGTALVLANSQEQAEKYALKEFGELHQPRVSAANEDDVSWFKLMDGRIAEI